MHMQFTVYDENGLAFVECLPRGSRVPRIGDAVKFPDSEDPRMSRVINVIWYMYRDSDPMLEVICRTCTERRCGETQEKP